MKPVIQLSSFCLLMQTFFLACMQRQSLIVISAHLILHWTPVPSFVLIYTGGGQRQISQRIKYIRNTHKESSMHFELIINATVQLTVTGKRLKSYAALLKPLPLKWDIYVRVNAYVWYSRFSCRNIHTAATQRKRQRHLFYSGTS